ncbi:TetR/AcrR family transcriptional regulator [Halorubellus sp. PRR65]|uniref:TetR/AcrR family transcriptional regulator n=1 Tax=Halorubellus sp. PRR65 TaxID=3098148 RepID=UPI002B25E712|nr:TetR/AcrR family transcriptional regulator [Halorubellus sp. PRR65]
MAEDAADAEATDTQTQIMEATYRALREHGYTDLTIAHIAETFDKSKSLLYYHYSSKDELVAAFLEFAGDRFLTSLDDVDEADPLDTVRRIVDVYLAVDVDDDMRDAQHIIIQLRAQAIGSPEYRAEFTRIDAALRDRIAAAIVDGVATGRIHEDVDPDRAATWLLSSLNGAMLERYTADHDVVDPVRTMIHATLDDLAADEAEA